MKKIKTLSILSLVAVCLVVAFGLAEISNSTTQKRTGTVISTIQTLYNPQVEEYVWVVRTTDGETEQVFCSEEVFKQKAIGDAVEFNTNYGWLTGTALKNYSY